MDFLDPRKKRAHKIRLLVGYILMAVAISIGTLILLLEAFGYDLYNRNGEVIQNGLMFVESRPNPASIFVNERPEGETGKRLVLPEGRYDVRLEKEGYHDWRRNFLLRGSSVERLTYPLLVPNELDTEDSQLYSSKPIMATQSPDRRWLIVLRAGNLNTFEVIDLSTDNNSTSTFNVPLGIFTPAEGRHELTAVEWSTNNRNVLVRHTFQGGSEFVMLNWREPAESFNVDETFSVPIRKVTMRDKKFDQLHILDTSNTLWFGESSNGRLTPVAERVLSYKSHGSDVLLYISAGTENPETVGVYIVSGSQTFLMSELPNQDSREYLLEIARYDDNWYIATSSSDKERAYVYKNPFGQLSLDIPRLPAPVAALRLHKPITNLSFSANAQFIGAQSGSEFAVYDAEHDRQSRFDTKLKLPSNYKAQWMDTHRYSVISSGKVVIFDFDGSNQQTLIDGYKKYMPVFDRDYETVYAISPSIDVRNRPALTRASLLIEADQ